ncbi:protein kinase domain-containing protein [Parafrankia sp. FMc2]|uniref:protein kinase domain-containing protein n=1 Tax=Parafrankia sp. FMc2 TaxID=3233196 RepID=UPI0034D3E995
MIVGRERVEKALPGYTVGERLGSGTFGLVLAGAEQRTGRLVAIKVMEGERAEGTTLDFAKEARVLAGLDHPHVVRAFDYAEAEGLCLVVMELLAGGTLSARRHGMAPEQACAVGLAVAAALEHAHGRRVLHRDIKADNILFAADGTPKVGDFGIAKLFEGSAATASGLAGTPMYMAPEQIEGGRLGPATDQYALGVVLYQLLTGVPPFDSRQPLPMLWRQHLSDPPPPMTGVADPVAAVVLRALAKAPADRHPGATAFALALAHAATEAYGPGWAARSELPLHLADDVRQATLPPPPPPPPSATPPQPAAVPAPRTSLASAHADVHDDETLLAGDEGAQPDQRWRRGARPVAAVAVLILVAVSLLVGRTVGRPGAGASTGSGAEAVSRTLAAEASRIAADEPALARRLAVAAYRTAPTPQAARSVIALFVPTSQPLATLAGHLEAVTGLVFSPDGKLLVTYSYDGSARLWDATASGENAQPLAVLGSASDDIMNEVLDAAFSPDSRLLATSSNGSVRLWDTTAQGGNVQPRAIFPTGSDFIDSMEFSPDGRLLVTRRYRDTAQLWRTDASGTAQPLATVGPLEEVLDVEFSPNSEVLATAGIATVQLWDVSTRDQNVRPLAVLTGHSSLVTNVVFSPDGETVVAGSDFDSTVRLWSASARSGNVPSVATLTGVTGVRFSPDRRFFAAYGGRSVRLWDASTLGRDVPPLATYTAPAGDIRDLVYRPDSRIFVTSAPLDGSVYLWDATARGAGIPPRVTISDESGDFAADPLARETQDPVFSPDGRFFATHSRNAAHLWDADARGTAAPLAMLPGEAGHLYGTVFSPDGKSLVTSSYDDAARLWNLDPGRMVTAACAEKTNLLTEAEWAAVVPDARYIPPCS